MRMSSLAEVTNASLSRLSHLVQRLEVRGLVRRRPDPADGRFTNAILTEKGFQTSPKRYPDTWRMCDRSSSTSCRPSNCDAWAATRTASCRASTPLRSTSGITSPRQLHQTGAQATAASSFRPVFVTESSLSQALIAPANPWATNRAMT